MSGDESTQLAVLLRRALEAHRRDEIARAQALYQELLSIDPQHAEAMHLMGVLSAQTGRLAAGLSLIAEAIRLRPDNAAAHSNRGYVLNELKRYEEALQSCQEAIRLQPRYAEAYVNRGNAQQGLSRYVEAVLSYEVAIGLQPFDAESHSSRGAAFHELKRYDASLKSYDEAIRLKPDYAEAHVNKSLLQLLHGNFGEGWVNYEWRLQADARPIRQQPVVQPAWRGAEALGGKAILLYAEQGLGDTIQFCRYARRLRASGATVILEVQPTLVPLIRTIGDGVTVIATGDPLPAFDVHAPLLSLPLAFGTTLGTIPSAERYLAADIEKVGRWKQRLGSRRKPRVGLSWNGNADHRKDRLRSIGFRELLGYLPDNAEYYALQNELRESDREAFMAQERVTWFGEELRDFSDTAALAECMDLLVSVDTSIAHLGGALGKRSWVLLPYVPDWRWLLDRDDSPWYPAVRLYRQGETRAWGEVLERVRIDISALR